MPDHASVRALLRHMGTELLPLFRGKTRYQRLVAFRRQQRHADDRLPGGQHMKTRQRLAALSVGTGVIDINHLILPEHAQRHHDVFRGMALQQRQRLGKER